MPKPKNHYSSINTFVIMKNYIRIFVATLLLLGACKTQKPVIQDGVTHAPIETIQPNADTTNYNYQPPRHYSMRNKVSKEFENYETAFDELKAMLEGKIEPNFERAVFISENPYHSNKYTYEEFQHNIDFHLLFIDNLIKSNDKSDSIDFNVKVNEFGRFNIDDIRHLPDEKKELYQKSLANWAIFTYLTDTTSFYSINILPFTYSTHDPFGIKNWSNSQVLNLISSKEKKGNCFALTALFKILSDRLLSEARICTAPQHIYIQHRDPKGDYYNVELATAGHPGDGKIQTLTHTTPEAINSGIALRSFDTRQSIGLCLVNLAKSFEHKFSSKDDDFMLKCAELALKHDRLNLNALLLKQQILDARIIGYVLEKDINDINTLKATNEISKSVNELEEHLALLYRLGYRQMPYDMQKIIMTGVIPENFEDKNPNPFTTIVPKEEHKRKFTTLYGGLFQEVFEIREFEPYGHFTFQTTTNKITSIDSTAQIEFLIDPVAFAYDFGARMYDARLGIFTSIDPLAHKYPGWSPYSAFANNPINMTDPDGREPRWGQLGNLKQILGEMWKAFNANDVVTATVGVKLEALSNHFAADRKFTRNDQGQLVDVDPSKNIDRYMYTEKAGWIDMHHFFRLANYTREHGQKMAELYAYNSERYQEWSGNPSGWSYEDIASDIAGIEFWLQYGDKLTKGEITVTDATEEFFKNLGAVEPSEAPNYEYIPHTINPEYVLKSANKRGLKGDDLRDRHKKVFESRPKEDQERIKDAHKTITD